MAEIRNPNLQAPGGEGGGSGGDMRGMITVMLLALVVLFGFDYFKQKPAAPASAPQTQNQPQPAQQAAGQSANPSQPSQPQVAGHTQALTAAPSVAAQTEGLTTIENDQYKIVFTNRGAQVKSWVLKKYFDTAGKPLDMVQQQVAQDFGYPLSFFTYEPALTTPESGALSGHGIGRAALGHWPRGGSGH